MLNQLSLVKVKASIIVEAPVEECWEVVRCWGSQAWMPLLPNGTNFDYHLLDSARNTEVGAIRLCRFGSGAQIFEKLAALDDINHSLRWHLVSHSETVSPFGKSSFVNFHTTLSLQAVTLNNWCFAEWKGEFYTDPPSVDEMRTRMEGYYNRGMSSLKEYMAQQCARRPAVALVPIMHPSLSGIGRNY